jgi:hypothetical protein
MCVARVPSWPARVEGADVPASRRARILALLVGDGRGDVSTELLCDVCVQVTGATGAGIMLMSGDIPRGSLWVTDRVSAAIEQLQFELGEGPCVDAYQQRQPILEPDLAAQATPRWPAFSAGALGAGARAVFGFPLEVGAVRLGALNVYRDTAGPLSEDEHAHAIVMAHVVAEALLALQADAPPGALATELELGANLQYVVHQASGMVAAQLETSVAHALIRLRGHAFGSGRPLSDVAKDVVARRLRFEDVAGETAG